MYVGDFSSWKDVSDNFTGQCYLDKGIKPIPEPAEVIFAGYESSGYDGSAFVVYRHGRQYKTVSGGHCSCYGLEDQWEPEAYTRLQLLEALKKGDGGMPSSLMKYRPQIIEALGG